MARMVTKMMLHTRQQASRIRASVLCTLLRIFLCGLVWLGAGGSAVSAATTPGPAGASPAAAVREVRGHTTDVPLARSNHPAAREALTELSADATASQRVRVIAGLRVPFAPEGRLNAEQQLQQRAEIASSQERVERLLTQAPAPRAAAPGALSLSGGSFSLGGTLASPVVGLGRWQDAGSPSSTPPVPPAGGAWVAGHP